MLITISLRLIALAARSWPTRSSTKIWRAGASSVLTRPMANANTYTTHTRSPPSATSVPNVALNTQKGGLRPKKDLATLETVDERAGPRPSEQRRGKGCRGSEREQDRAPGELQDQPRHCDAGHRRPRRR